MVFAFILFFICYLPVDNGLHEIQVFLSHVDYFIFYIILYIFILYYFIILYIGTRFIFLIVIREGLLKGW